ncbi:hypothetical protein PISL3812_00768 [Talaromyces islandicus]|uniref:Rhodopsin domain-containing protein n=1 Tax=Talaromyces islandicus TaxID=28573 RepID=A0A0U1LK75_TALIS|nr:hypothetical protein PISL3812_00768 [Talaromyces islandicus]
MVKDSYNPLAVAAGKVPPGLSPEDRNSVYHGVPMTVVLSVFACFALAFYMTRIYAKIVIVRRLGWDDLLCTIGVLGAILDIVCFGVSSINGPLGKHMWNITLAQFLSNNFVITGYIMQVTASATLGVIKLTIFIFYAEIFWVLEWCRWVIYIGASISSAFYLSMTIVQFYFMTPRPGETMAEHFGGKMAARVTSLSIPTTSVGLAIDILLLVVPLCAVVQLHLAKMKKVQLILTFLIGIFAILGSVLSLSFKIMTYGNPDLTYHLILVNFFISIEMIFGICIACAPLVSRTARYHRGQITSIVQSLSISPRSLPSFVSPVQKSSSLNNKTPGSGSSAQRSGPGEQGAENQTEMSEIRSFKKWRGKYINTRSEGKLWSSTDGTTTTTTMTGTTHTTGHATNTTARTEEDLEQQDQLQRDSHDDNDGIDAHKHRNPSPEQQV